MHRHLSYDLMLNLGCSLFSIKFDIMDLFTEFCGQGILQKGVCRSWRLLSTYSNRVDEPFKVEELEKINVSPSEKIDVSSPSLKKLLVLGGNGFVGSRVSRSFEA
ncbi:hypothetical protein MRB53_023438 [Persea americana]|uniref:Uncharacterized protein n=1 Tax=Persea americana TaxID=3435 RepID=A0ACC2L9S9_PERAE|nr:hypothetical protein MRB53_023438 [Persea americana]